MGGYPPEFGVEVWPHPMTAAKKYTRTSDLLLCEAVLESPLSTDEMRDIAKRIEGWLMTPSAIRQRARAGEGIRSVLLQKCLEAGAGPYVVRPLEEDVENVAFLLSVDYSLLSAPQRELLKRAVATHSEGGKLRTNTSVRLAHDVEDIKAKIELGAQRGATKYAALRETPNRPITVKRRVTPNFNDPGPLPKEKVPWVAPEWLSNPSLLPKYPPGDKRTNQVFGTTTYSDKETPTNE
jgi:hypothetical protein